MHLEARGATVLIEAHMTSRPVTPRIEQPRNEAREETARPLSGSAPGGAASETSYTMSRPGVKDRIYCR